MESAVMITSVMRVKVSWSNTWTWPEDMKPTLCIPGDCDNDNECAGDLVCGNNKCFTDFGWPKDLLTDAGSYTTSHDCCEKSKQSDSCWCFWWQNDHLMPVFRMKWSWDIKDDRPHGEQLRHSYEDQWKCLTCTFITAPLFLGFVFFLIVCAHEISPSLLFHWI